MNDVDIYDILNFIDIGAKLGIVFMLSLIFGALCKLIGKLEK